jgi:hypothetical protein
VREARRELFEERIGLGVLEFVTVVEKVRLLPRCNDATSRRRTKRFRAG